MVDIFLYTVVENDNDIILSDPTMIIEIVVPPTGGGGVTGGYNTPAIRPFDTHFDHDQVFPDHLEPEVGILTVYETDLRFVCEVGATQRVTTHAFSRKMTLANQKKLLNVLLEL